MLRQFALLLIALLIATPSAFAVVGNGHGVECASCHTLSEKEATELVKNTGVVVTSVKHSPVKGLFELQVERNGQKGLMYMDYGKKHLMQGMVFDREKLEPVAAHKMALPQPRKQASVDVRTIPSGGSITMGNPKGTRKLYVITDPDCPYCRSGHGELKKLAKMDPDLAIVIVLYPLPMHPNAYDKARVIVETQSLDILDKAFAGKEVPKPKDENSRKLIDANIAFANASGISGTPSLVMSNGKVEVGMRDAETLKKMLDQR